MEAVKAEPGLGEHGQQVPRGWSGPAGLRVMVVDDDPLCLKVVEQMLRRCTYDVHTCNNAASALQLLREKRHGFDLVLSDVYMPGACVRARGPGWRGGARASRARARSGARKARRAAPRSGPLALPSPLPGAGGCKAVERWAQPAGCVDQRPCTHGGQQQGGGGRAAPCSPTRAQAAC